MLNILLIRAGSTEYASQGRVQGTLDVPLSEEGRRQAELAAGQLCDQSIEALYCGPCRASQQTAEIIGQEWDLRPRPNEKLQNLDHGLWQGMLVKEVKAKLTTAANTMYCRQPERKRLRMPFLLHNSWDCFLTILLFAYVSYTSPPVGMPCFVR